MGNILSNNNSGIAIFQNAVLGQKGVEWVIGCFVNTNVGNYIIAKSGASVSVYSKPLKRQPVILTCNYLYLQIGPDLKGSFVSL